MSQSASVFVDQRTGEVTALSDIPFAKYCAALSEQVTGKSREEHEAEWKRRRREGYRSGHFRGGVMLQLSSDKAMKAMDPGEVTEFDAYCRHYGLHEDDDFVTVTVPITVAHRVRKEARMKAFPRIPVGPKGAAQTIIVAMLNPEKYPS